MPDLSYLFVDFSLNEEEFLTKFEAEREKLPEFNFVEVTNIPTATKGLELISKDWFKLIICEPKVLFGINLRIHEKVDENFKEKPHFFEVNFKDSFLISFQSTTGECESKTYWKIPSRGSFYSTYIDDDEDENVLAFFQEFLIEEINDGKSGKESFLNYVTFKGCRMF